MTMLDDLELELRKLPGVRAAGFDERDDVLMIQLHVGTVTGPEPDVPLPIAATRIATRHSDRQVAVEVVRWRDAPAPAPSNVTTVSPPPTGPAPVAPTPEPAAPAVAPVAPVPTLEGAERPRLLAVLSFPDTDELEVHLVRAGRRTIGRAPASRGLVGAVEATLEAIRSLDLDVSPSAQWARALDSEEGSILVAVSLAVDDPDDGTVHAYGLAAGSSPIDAAARSALDALNRRLTRTV
jgi:hypothetical protein